MSYYVNTLIYDLSTARARYAESGHGHRIEILEANDASAMVEIFVRGRDHRDSGPFQLRKGDYVEFPEQFEEILITNAAQSNIEVKLGVTLMDVPPAKYDFFRGTEINIEEITKPVTTCGGNVATTAEQTLSTSESTALAGKASRTGWLIQNPAGNPTIYWGYGTALHPLLAGASAGGSGRDELKVKAASGTPTIVVTEEAES